MSEDNIFQFQPKPVANEKPPITALVILDMNECMKVGIERYGTPLQGFNGRDALRDAYEEALDLCQYLRQVMFERDGK